MTTGWRPWRGIGAVCVASLLLTPVAIAVILVADAGGESFFELIGGGLVMMVWYGIIIIPVVLISCILLFLIQYYFFKAIRGALRPGVFPWSTAVILLVLSFADGYGFKGWRLKDYLMVPTIPAFGYLLGYIFTKYAAPVQPKERVPFE